MVTNLCTFNPDSIHYRNVPTSPATCVEFGTPRDGINATDATNTTTLWMLTSVGHIVTTYWMSGCLEKGISAIFILQDDDGKHPVPHE